MQKKGKHFVMTQKGYDKTPDHIKHERKIGLPVSDFYETTVPVSWLEKGYVEEVPYNLNNTEKLKVDLPKRKQKEIELER